MAFSVLNVHRGSVGSNNSENHWYGSPQKPGEDPLLTSQRPGIMGGLAHQLLYTAVSKGGWIIAL